MNVPELLHYRVIEQLLKWRCDLTNGKIWKVNLMRWGQQYSYGAKYSKKILISSVISDFFPVFYQSFYLLGDIMKMLLRLKQTSLLLQGKVGWTHDPLTYITAHSKQIGFHHSSEFV